MRLIGSNNIKLFCKTNRNRPHRFCFLRTLLDANGNRKIDSEDTPIANVTFYVELDGVKAFGHTTDETGFAFILIPGSVEYPVNVVMEAPKDSTLKPITPSTVTVSEGISSTQFLFSLK